MDQMRSSKNNEHQVVFPSNFGLSSGGKIYPQDIREEECCKRIGRALRAKVRGEDFSRNRVLIDVDECSIARVAKLIPLIYYLR